MSLPKFLTQEEAETLPECQNCGTSLTGWRSWTCERSKGESRFYNVWCFKCDQDARYHAWQETKILTSRLMTDAFYIKDPILDASLERVYVKSKEFEKAVWFGGMQRVVVASVSSGMSFKLKDFEVMSFCSAARCMITIQNKEGKSITLITEEKSKEKRMGVQGICATEQEAIALLDMAIRLHKKGATLEDDRKVGLG